MSLEACSGRQDDWIQRNNITGKFERVVIEPSFVL